MFLVFERLNDRDKTTILWLTRQIPLRGWEARSYETYPGIFSGSQATPPPPPQDLGHHLLPLRLMGKKLNQKRAEQTGLEPGTRIQDADCGLTPCATTHTPGCFFFPPTFISFSVMVVPPLPVV